MNNPPPLPPRARDYLDDPRRSSTPSGLPRSMLRSRAPGYLLATLGVLAVGGFIAWKVVGQAEAIHAAETKAPNTAPEPDTSPVPVLVDVPSAAATAEGVAISRLGTTGAVVAAPAATTRAPEAMSAGFELLPGATVAAAVPKVKPMPAAEPVATERIHATPHPDHAASPHRHPHAVHRHPVPVPSDRGLGDDANPYDQERAPSAAPSAPPADTSGLFDLRE